MKSIKQLMAKLYEFDIMKNAFIISEETPESASSKNKSNAEAAVQKEKRKILNFKTKNCCFLYLIGSTNAKCRRDSQTLFILL